MFMPSLVGSALRDSILSFPQCPQLTAHYLPQTYFLPMNVAPPPAGELANLSFTVSCTVKESYPSKPADGVIRFPRHLISERLPSTWTQLLTFVRRKSKPKPSNGHIFVAVRCRSASCLTSHEQNDHYSQKSRPMYPISHNWQTSIQRGMITKPHLEIIWATLEFH